MKLYIQNDSGAMTEIREIESLINADTLFFMSSMRLSEKDIDTMEKDLSQKTGKNCIILDGKFSKVLGI